MIFFKCCEQQQGVVFQQVVVTLFPARKPGTNLICIPGRFVRKGGCSMTLSEVLQLLAVIGGAVFVTFQITWTISNSKKK